MKKDAGCNLYEGGVVPPCCAFLGNIEPLIKDGKIIYRNENRVFFFISTIFDPSARASLPGEPETTNPITERPYTSSNLQISLATFLTGMYINQIQLGNIIYDQTSAITSDETADEFIHQTFQNPPEIVTNYETTLSIIVSHSGSVIPLYTQAWHITPLSYYILFILNRLENNPGLFFGNNSFVEDDPINFVLASLNIQFPLK